MRKTEVHGEGREAIISVRLSSREEAEIKQAAERSGEPISAFVRGAALKVARPGKVAGPSWSTKATTVAPAGTVLPRYYGTVDSSRPSSSEGTQGTSAEPITRAR